MKRSLILSIAAALAALTGSPADAKTPPMTSSDNNNRSDEARTHAVKGQPNVLVKAGEDLLGLIVTQNPDGTVVAQHSSHYSHSSHASHSSHSSHASSRF